MSEANPPDPTDNGERAIILAAIADAGASQVVEIAARLARRAWSHAELHLIHVFRAGILDRAPPGGMSNADLVEEAKLHLEHHARMARRQCSCLVKGHFATGAPAREIVGAARFVNADIIVVGKVERMILDRLLMGSVTDAVVRAAACSVLVVRAREHERWTRGSTYPNREEPSPRVRRNDSPCRFDSHAFGSTRMDAACSDESGTVARQVLASGFEVSGFETTAARRVLVAEDDPATRALVVAALRCDGFQVDEAEDGRRMWFFTIQHGRYDLIVADLRLPIVDGFTVVEDFLARFPGTPVILIDSLGDERARARSARLGALLLDRPIEADELRAAARRLCEDVARRGTP
jgi:CheY-like chemotaxis protein/nucleotide-binding universal stress UspA family protein